MSGPSMDSRRQALKSGAALPPSEPGGPPRFPIRNRGELDSAIRLAGQAPKAEQPMVRRYIMKRARALGLSSMIPGSWSSDGTRKTAS